MKPDFHFISKKKSRYKQQDFLIYFKTYTISTYDLRNNVLSLRNLGL